MARLGRAFPARPHIGRIPQAEAAAALSTDTPVPVIRVNFARKPSFFDYMNTLAPTSWWRCKETTGAVAFDYAGRNDMTWVNGPTLGQDSLVTEDKAFDAAVRLDGSASYGSVPDAATLDHGDTFTYLFSIRLNALGIRQTLAAKGTGGVEIYVNASNQLVLAKQGTADIVASTSTLDTTRQLLIVTKSTTTSRLFIAGLEVTGTVINQTITDTATALEIGRDGSTNFLNGIVDEVAVWNRALTDAEVSIAYSAWALGELGASIDSISTTKVRRAVVSGGRNQDRTGERVGTLALLLRNDDGYFSPERNLAVNPSTEHGLDGWAVVSAGAMAWVEDAPSGLGSTRSIKATAAGSNDGVSQVIEANGRFRAGVPVSFGIYIKNISGVTAMRLRLRDGTTDVDLDFAVTGDWAQYGPVTLTPVADRTSITIEVKTQPLSGAAVFHVAGLQVNRGSTLNEYTNAPTWQMLQPGALTHAYATYQDVDYPLFTGQVDEPNLHPARPGTAEIFAKDAFAELSVPIDVALAATIHHRARYYALDAAHRANTGAYSNLIMFGDGTTNGWTFGGGAAGGSNYDIPGNGRARYNVNSSDVPYPTLSAGRYYLLRFKAKLRGAADSLGITFGVTDGTGNASVATGDGGLPALTSSYQTYSVPWLADVAGTPYIDFDPTSGAGAKGAIVDDIMVTDGVGQPDYVGYGSPVGRLKNYLWEGGAQAPEVSPIWQHGWYNWVTNPEAATNTAGWNATVSWPVTDVGATITRVTAGSYYGGGGNAPAFATAFELNPTATPAGEGMWFALPEPAVAGRTYRARIFVTAGVGNTWSLKLGVSGDNDSVQVSDIANASYGVSWTPAANQASPVLGIVGVAGTGEPLTISGIMVSPGSHEYARTGINSPANLTEAATITTATDGVSHRTCTEVTTEAIAGSGVAVETLVHQINGVTYVFTPWLWAPSGTGELTVGIADPFGADSTPEAASRTVTLTTTPQRFPIALAGTETNLVADATVTCWLASTGAAVTFRVDDESLTIGSRIQDYLVPEATALDIDDTDILPALTAGNSSALGILNDLNQSLARHWIRATMNHPNNQVVTPARHSHAAPAGAPPLDDLFVDVTGLQFQRSRVWQHVVVSPATSGYSPGSATATAFGGLVRSTSDQALVDRNGKINVLSHAAETINPPLGTDSSAQDIADLLQSRHSIARARPQLRWLNRFPEMLDVDVDDRVEASVGRAFMSEIDLSILSRVITIGDAALHWERVDDTEEFVPS